MIVAISGVGSGLGSYLFMKLSRYHCEVRGVIGLSRRVIESTALNTFQHHVAGDAGTDGWGTLMSESKQRFSKYPDVLINCATIYSHSKIEDLSDPVINESLQTNIGGYVKGIREMTRTYSESPRRIRIINIGSIASRTPMRYSTMYNLSKSAVDMLTKQSARELAGRNPAITVVGLNPGLFDTHPNSILHHQIASLRNITVQEAIRNQVQSIPQKRTIRHDEILDMVSFLLNSPETLTGSILEISGGA
jgi:3-oxoacyl-[acyl-carrier protein] reductase